MSPRPRVFSIPCSVNFLPTLITALDEQRLVPGFPDPDDPLSLARATIYLPTRRACRTVRELFLTTLKRDAGVLPRLLALGDIEAEGFGFASEPTELGSGELEIAPALESTERRLLLARLVQQWAAKADSRGPAVLAHNALGALGLADELARLIDDMTTREVDWERLDKLVPERFDTYWQLSLDFLKLARQAWPAVLQARRRLEPALRRERLLAAEQARIASLEAPLIAAGSTGSMPATAALIAAIANHRYGAVVLPGLDTDLDTASWQAIGGGGDNEPALGHPQFALQRLLARMGVAREAVSLLAPPRNPARGRLLSEAFRPAASTELWQHRLAEGVRKAALDDVAVIEAANAEEEALAIAISLREAIEPEGAKSALLTADPDLARRVAAALGRWNIRPELTAGMPLANTPAGVFARLAAEVALRHAGPSTVLALLKHPLFRLGGRRYGHDWAINAVERAILRGPPPRPGSLQLRQALAAVVAQRSALHRHDPRSLLSEAELAAATELLGKLSAALEPLESLEARPLGFAEIARRHRDVMLALGSEAGGAIPVFADDAGSALTTLFDEISATAAHAHLEVLPRDYPQVLAAAMAEPVIAAPALLEARVQILGPLESRLQSFATVVLGGLIEGSWPPEARGDAWLSRPMRQQLGLDLAERRIGLSAHDFAQALGARKVVLTRAAKLAGTPTVASRFLRRLAVVAGEAAWNAALARGEQYLALARQLDLGTPAVRIAAPQPRPPREARPSFLTVTDVEHWLRDPYTIYAKHVLKLQPLEPVNTPLGARDRGNAIHAAVAAFTKQFADNWPADPLGELLGAGAEAFAALQAYPEARALWWPRFLRIARWFVDWEQARRHRRDASLSEVRGEIRIPLGNRTFRLAARADRIDRLKSGRYLLIDYKTGEARSEKQVRSGLAPQLTLEAAILRNGGFAPIAAGASVEALLYVKLGGGEPPGEERRIDFCEGTPDSQADRALARFIELLTKFEDESQPFRSLVHPMWKARYGEYDHLARVKEWSATAAAVEGE